MTEQTRPPGLFDVREDHPMPDCFVILAHGRPLAVCIDDSQYGDAARWPDPYPAHELEQP